MGNCLNCIGVRWQDSINLLNGSSSSLSVDTSGNNPLRSSLPYNEMSNNYHSSEFVREPRLRFTETGINHGQGIGVALNNESGRIMSDEEQQVRIAKRIGLIQHLPTRQFDGLKKSECVICMMELMTGEEVRFLPCMHTYHAACIDDWLLRSLTCPTCMEPVDAALINSYNPTT